MEHNKTNKIIDIPLNTDIATKLIDAVKRRISLKMKIGNSIYTIYVDQSGDIRNTTKEELDEIYHSAPALSKKLSDKGMTDIAWGEHVKDLFN